MDLRTLFCLLAGAIGLIVVDARAFYRVADDPTPHLNQEIYTSDAGRLAVNSDYSGDYGDVIEKEDNGDRPIDQFLYKELKDKLVAKLKALKKVRDNMSQDSKTKVGNEFQEFVNYLKSIQKTMD